MDTDSYGAPLATQAIATALLGLILMGWSLHLILYGVVLSCFTRYRMSELYQCDPKRVKVALWVVFLLTTAAIGINIQELFQAGVLQSRSTEDILSGTLGASFEPLVTGLTALVVQLFLAQRTLNLFENRTLKTVFAAVILLLIAGAFTGSLMVTALSFMYYNGTVDNALPLTFNISTGVWLWLSAAADIAISLGLLWNLRAHMRGFNRVTDSLLKKIIVLALRTAAFTSAFALAGAIAGVTIAEDDLMATDVPYVFWLPMPSLYALSVFTTLNARKGLRKAVAVNRVGVFSTSGIECGPVPHRQPVEIRVDRDIQVKTEEKDEDETL